MIYLPAVFAQITRDQVNLPDNVLDQTTVDRGRTIALVVFGAIALVMMSYAGYKYITSQGNSQETQKAQNTIMYTLIGLVVAIFVTTLISFVITRL